MRTISTQRWSGYARPGTPSPSAVARAPPPDTICNVFTALLDTCVLWPSLQRDFLLSLAVEGMYRPVWSAVILEELEYGEAAKLVTRGCAVSEAERRARHLIEQMRAAFGDAEVEGWEALDGAYGLPDPDDEHVLAAAVVAGAGAIVTDNTKHFPQSSLPIGIKAISPR